MNDVGEWFRNNPGVHSFREISKDTGWSLDKISRQAVAAHEQGILERTEHHQYFAKDTFAKKNVTKGRSASEEHRHTIVSGLAAICERIRSKADVRIKPDERQIAHALAHLQNKRPEIYSFLKRMPEEEARWRFVVLRRYESELLVNYSEDQFRTDVSKLEEMGNELNLFAGKVEDHEEELRSGICLRCNGEINVKDTQDINEIVRFLCPNVPESAFIGEDVSAMASQRQAYRNDMK